MDACTVHTAHTIPVRRRMRHKLSIKGPNNSSMNLSIYGPYLYSEDNKTRKREETSIYFLEIEHYATGTSLIIV